MNGQTIPAIRNASVRSTHARSATMLPSRKGEDVVVAIIALARSVLIDARNVDYRDNFAAV
jgi:hypothetical protein